MQARLIAFAAAWGSLLMGVGCSDDSDPMGPTPAAGAIGPGTGGGVGVGGDVGTGGVGAGGSAPVPVQPTVAGTVFTLQTGDMTFAVDAGYGARVTAFGLGGLNLLTGGEVDPANFGSTFWPAPQSAWGWPPPAPIDAQPYTGQIVGSEIVLQSAPDPTTGITVEKRFSADTSGWVTQTFTMINSSTAPQSWAPWQVTRVVKTGFAFFPVGPGGVQQTDLVTQLGAEAWFDAALSVSGDKLFADGTGGWLAYATGSQLFVMRFTDLAPGAEASGEAEIEIYSGNGYIELEVQGPLLTLNVGETSPWTISWKVIPLAVPAPASLDAVDTASLVAQAAQIAAE